MNSGLTKSRNDKCLKCSRINVTDNPHITQTSRAKIQQTQLNDDFDKLTDANTHAVCHSQKKNDE